MAETLSGSLVFDGWTPPADALVRIELLDVTHADAPSTSVAASDVRLGPAVAGADECRGPARLHFALSVAEPDPTAEYIVSATVRTPESIVGRTEVSYPVLTYGRPSHHLELHVHQCGNNTE